MRGAYLTATTPGALRGVTRRRPLGVGAEFASLPENVLVTLCGGPVKGRIPLWVVKYRNYLLQWRR